MGDEQALLANVVDNLPLGVWIARAPGGDFVFANKVFREIMGMDARPDVAAGEYAAPYGICTREGTPYPEELMPFVRALRARTTITVDDIVIHRPDGGKVNIRATARPIFARPDGGGDITHVVIAFADITAELAAETAKRESEERLRASQRLESLGRLAAGVAHDFNNMLASIRLLASYVAHSDPSPVRRADLRRIEDVTESAAQLTRALLAFGRSGGADAVPVDLADLAKALVEVGRHTFDRAVELRFEASAGPAVVLGDPAQLEQVVLNLLVNARDAMLPGGGVLTVRIAVDTLTAPPAPLAPGRYVVLEVADTGPGVPAELRDRIFEPYFTTKIPATGDTAPGAPGETHPGAGLGLATVYGVAKTHGGAVEVRDAAPHGALFRVVLPVADAVPARRDARHETPAVRGHGTILVVDDEPLVRAAASAGLAAVLLDAVMPRLGGRETFLRIRAMAPELPVVLTTGRAGPDEMEDLVALGVDHFLPKPFDLRALSRTLADAMRPRGGAAGGSPP
jgi:signal transduction histidine kinase